MPRSSWPTQSRFHNSFVGFFLGGSHSFFNVLYATLFTFLFILFVLLLREKTRSWVGREVLRI